MPLFKIRATDEVRTTYEIYVEAVDAKSADAYAAGLDSLEDAPGVFVERVESIGGEIETVQLVEAAPEGAIPIRAEWKGGVAISPIR
jgi:hypothetical protein